MLPHPMSRTSPEGLGWVEGCLSPWRCLCGVSTTQEKSMNPKQGELKRTSFPISRGGSSSHDASWSPDCKVSDNTQSYLLALGEERSHPQQGERPVVMCVSVTRGDSDWMELWHFTPDEEDMWNFKVGLGQSGQDFDRSSCICLMHYLEIFLKMDIFQCSWVSHMKQNVFLPPRRPQRSAALLLLLLPCQQPRCCNTGVTQGTESDSKTVVLISEPHIRETAEQQSHFPAPRSLHMS